jgi:hypothetical protein
MTNYGLIVIINKYDNYFETIKETFVCTNLDDCKEKLINYLALEFNKLTIDFPLELNDFEYIWFKHNYTKSNVFSYTIFNSEIIKWEEPWELQDLYYEVIEKIHEIEIADGIDFTKLYAESNLDDEDNVKDNNFLIN